MSAQSMDPILITVDQAAEVLGLSNWRIYDLLNKGEIESRYLGRGTRRVVVESLREYVAGLPTDRPESA